LTESSPEQTSLRRLSEVFCAFGWLGLTSFGGPIAHLAYFRSEFVERRGWLKENDFADLIALCQFLPGPASSQAGFAIGLMRAGPWGAAAAWLAFTLPSAILMLAFALAAAGLEGALAASLVQGLKILAVAVVAHAVLGMARALCPERRRATIGLLAAIIMLAVGGVLSPLIAILLGALGGVMLLRPSESSRSDAAKRAPTAPTVSTSTRSAWLAGVLFLALLFGLPLAVWLSPGSFVDLIDSFYRSGALVFGGGHVVLPLLEAELVQSGQITADAFVAGYGAAQALPGPLFTFAAYLGALLAPGGSGWLGASLALVAIFLPGLLLLVALLPAWNHLRSQPSARALMDGANAAVVGVLGAALYDPLWTSAITGPIDATLALLGLVLLQYFKWPSWAVVLTLPVATLLLSAISQ